MDSQWVVLKFGGTSVARRARWETIAEQVRARLSEGLRPVVVCSAISGISNMLEAVLEAAPRGEHEPRLAEIEARHAELAEALGVDMAPLIGEELASLKQLAMGISLTGEVSPRLHARVMACGELMSTRLGAAFLNAQGVEAAWVDARTCLCTVDQPHEKLERRYVSAACDHESDEALQARFEAIAAPVILTQGFIAHNARRETVLLGRGGSDTSAAYFAARLLAERCEIWTDVPGMFSANPRQIGDARLLKALAYDEAQEIASTGAKVLHPRCIAPVRKHQIPLHIRCTEAPQMSGTVIGPQSGDATPRVKAISAKSRQTLVSIDTPGMWQQVGFLADVFVCFKERGFSVDLVSTSEMNVTVSLDPASNVLDAEALASLEASISQRADCKVQTIGPCAAISLVGRNIRAILHKLGPALAVFEEQHVYLVSQAASDLNLSFVVDEAQAERLTRRLHQLLFEGVGLDEVFGASWETLFAPEPVEEVEEVAEKPWWHVRRDDLLALAEASSPRYVYDGASLDAAAQRLRGLSSVDRVFYAIKANPNPDILRRFHALGLGFECVSPGELEHVFGLFPGLSPQRVLFTPNFAPRQEYEAGFARGVWVTLDNLHPLESWPEIFAGRELLVRLDPGQGRGHHDYVKTAGARSKFGVSGAQLGRLTELAASVGAKIVGLHAHTGSGILSPEEWADTALTLARAAERLPEVRILDIGGGLGVPNRPSQSALDMAAVDARLAEFKAAHPRFELWMEPGRYLVADAGVLLTTVTQLKDKGDVRYVGVNTGMNSLIRPALYGAWHEIINLTRLDAASTEVVNVVGPICESGDTLGHNRHLPTTQEGDVLLLATAGAYGRAMSSHYNLRSPATEVVI